MKTSVRRAGGPSEIQTEHLLNTSQERYRYVILLGRLESTQLYSVLVIMNSMHDAYKLNAYRGDHVCPFVHPHVSTREMLDRF
jgi:hypothetical protein